MEEHKLENVTHGIIVLDPETLNEGNMDILHFCGYWNEINENDIEGLREELRTDEEFGLTEIIDRLIIVEAPKEIVDLYCRPNE